MLCSLAFALLFASSPLLSQSATQVTPAHVQVIDDIITSTTSTCGTDDITVLNNGTSYDFGIFFNRYLHDNGDVVPASFLYQTDNGASLVAALNTAFNGADINFFLVGDEEITFPSSQIVPVPGVGDAGHFVTPAYTDQYTCPDYFYVTLLPDAVTSPTANGQAIPQSNVAWIKPDINDYDVFLQILIHELGHCLGLLESHQFYDTADPENVTRMTNDPCCNCLTAGDRICDTPADPGAFYNQNGIEYFPDARTVDGCGNSYPDPPASTLLNNYMVYGDQRNHFVPGQHAMMKRVVPILLTGGFVSELANIQAPVLTDLVVPSNETLVIDEDRILNGRIEVAGKLELVGCNVQIASDSYIALVDGGDLEINDATVEHYNGPLPCAGTSQGDRWLGIQLESMGSGVSRIDIEKSTIDNATVLFSTNAIRSGFRPTNAAAPLTDRPSRIRIEGGSSLNNHLRLAYLNSSRSNSLSIRETSVTFDGAETGSPVGISDGYIYTRNSKVEFDGALVTKQNSRFNFQLVNMSGQRLAVDAKGGLRSTFSGIETVFRATAMLGVEIFNADFVNCQQLININASNSLDLRNCSFDQASGFLRVVDMANVPIYDVRDNTFTRSANDSRLVQAIFMNGQFTESQIHDNQISGNKLVNLDYGIFATGQVGDEIRGLQFYCNDYDNCDEYNIDVTGRMKLLHGSTNEPAGNRFSSVNTTDGHIRYITQSPQMTYWYQNLGDQEPTKFTAGAVDPNIAGLPSQCGTIGHDGNTVYVPTDPNDIPTTLPDPQVPTGGPFTDPGNGLVGGPNDPSGPNATNPPDDGDCADGPNAPNDPTNSADPTNPLYGDYNLAIDADYVDGYNVVRNNYWTFMDGGTTLSFVDSIYQYSDSEGRSAILTKAHALYDQLSPRAAIAFIENIEYYCLSEIITIITKSPVALQNPTVEAFIIDNCPTCVLPDDLSNDCLYKEGMKHSWLSTKREEYLRSELHALLRDTVVNVPAVKQIASHYSGIPAISYVLSAYKQQEDYTGAVAFLDNEASNHIQYHYSPPVLEYIDVERHVLGVRASGRSLDQMTEPEQEALIQYGYLPEYAGALARAYVHSFMDLDFGDSVHERRDYTVTGGPCPYSSEAVDLNETIDLGNGLFIPADYRALAEADDLRVEVYDIAGQLVYSKITRLPAGIYVIRCRSEALQQTYSFKQFITND